MPTPPTSPPLPKALPEGTTLRAELARREGVRVVRAERGGVDRVLRLEAGRGDEGLAELAVLAAVDHPGIAPLREYGVLPGGVRWVARDWIEGTDLLAWYRGLAPRTDEELGDVLARLADALDHLHRLGFVHADLKPENVLVDPGGRPVLCDFGLARRAGPDRSAAPTGGVSGSLFALAPEVLLGAAPTPAADLFALGVLVHGLLVGSRVAASEFYARFPERSFFDAARTSPDELPAWARDLVASLVARDPARRPTAAAVARTLRARLGAEDPGEAGTAGDPETDLRFGVELGREAWLASWYTAAAGEVERAPRWVRVPPGEDPRAVRDVLRLHAALRGRPTRALDAGSDLDGLRTPRAVDTWARGLAAEGAGLWILAALERDDPWQRRCLSALARAIGQRRDEDPATLFVVAEGEAEPGPEPGPEPGAEWRASELPALAEPDVERILARRFPGEDPERLRAFARVAHGATRGASRGLARLFARAHRDGWVLDDAGGLRLRPGELPTALALGPDAAEAPRANLSAEARRVTRALSVCNGRATMDELAAVLGDEALLSRAAPGLVRARVARFEQSGGGGLELVLEERPEVSGESAADEDELRAMHRRRAAHLRARGGEPGHALAHAWRADPRDEALAAVVAELARLRELGCTEKAHELLDRMEAHVAATGADLAADFPRLLVERALSWARLGRGERALPSIEALRASPHPRAEAFAELASGMVALLRHRADAAHAHLERAAELDPALEAEALTGRVDLLHREGRDAEVVAAVEELSRSALAGMLRRQHAYLESLAAVSRYRLGEVDAARETLDRLVGEARALDDAGREAALRIDLATLERRAGSQAAAEEHLERAIDLYERCGVVSGLALARSTLGGLLRERGEMLRAEVLLASAMESRERLGDLEGANVTRGMLGMLLAERGHARGAIEELSRSAGRMRGAQKIRFAPLLFALSDEMRARLGEGAEALRGDGKDEHADPRVFLSRARTAWLLGRPDEADALAARAERLAGSLGQGATESATRLLRAQLALAGGGDGAVPDPPEHAAVAEDARIFALLRSDVGAFPADEVERLAGDLETRGRDDRAARLWIALAARVEDEARAASFEARAVEALGRAGVGLTDEETRAFRATLLGIPDPRPGDLTPRPGPRTDEELEMEIVSLLEINHRLLEQKDLTSLLGSIVDHALRVTGGERGFLILEENGSLRFDTALDSSRGDVAQPDLEVSRSVVHDALERMEPVRLSNAVDDPLLGHNPSVVSLELRSILCVPFRVSSEVRGAIYVDHRLRSGAFGDRAERLCTLLADQAGLAILQVRRLEEIRRLNDRLERRVVQQETDLVAARTALERAGVDAAPPALLGSSAPMAAVRALIDRAARADIPVLVTGASGTGKEIAARTLHERSARASGPFVTENCAALPESLIESELFGYKRGAFTGADDDREGLFERADGGTLFLDEIGDMPLALQAKLLRVLETGEVRRLGDSETRRVDFRLVAATNRDLERESGAGGFRQDLFYRLDGLRVDMPSLAERTEDVPELVAHFLALQADGGPPRRATRPVLAALGRRPWPGNVRELRNEVARLVVLSEGDLDDPSLVRQPEFEVRVGEDGPPQTLAELERRAILDALAYTGDDKRRAAELLGISRAKIYQRLKDWDDGGEG